MLLSREGHEPPPFQHFRRRLQQRLEPRRRGAANVSASGLKQQDDVWFETDDQAAVEAFRAAFEAARVRRASP